MDQHADTIIKVSSALSYSTSFGLIVGQLLDFLNQNAMAFGVILGFMTFCLNWRYQHLNHKAIKRSAASAED